MRVPVVALEPAGTRTLIELTGKISGELTVIRFHESRRPPNGHGMVPYWWCRCSCGNELAVAGQAIREGRSSSCGCQTGANISAGVIRHGHCSRKGKRTAEYTAWASMRDRCHNRNNKRYADWGGRGITICKRWSDFTNFLEDMKPKPSPRHMLERRDNDKNYCPENCYWATSKEQNNNRRNSVRLTHDGKTQTVLQWATDLGVRPGLIKIRLFRGWTVERALTTPVVSPKRGTI